MNCLLNVLGYAIFIPATLVYKILSIGESSPPAGEDGAPNSGANPPKPPQS